MLKEPPIQRSRFRSDTPRVSTACLPICLAGLTLLYDKRRADDDVIDLGMGNPSDPPEEVVIRKLAEAARIRATTATASRRGILNLRREVASKYLKRTACGSTRVGGDRLPGVEGGVQPHVPGADGARRHRDHPGAVLSGPHVRRGAGGGQRRSRWRWPIRRSSCRTSPTPASTSTRVPSC
jgi:hypothetical protein